MRHTTGEDSVEYTYESADTQTVFFNKPEMTDLEIDYSDTPVALRGGTARRLLAASVLCCMVGTVGAALEARGVPIRSLSGKADVVLSDTPPKRVTAIDVEIRLGVAEGYDKEVSKVETILSRGCLISRSLASAITIRERIIRV